MNKRELLLESLKVLELPRFVSYKEIKSQYHKLSKLYHPDANGASGEMFQKINNAYKTLKEYVENYRFEFSVEEINRQYPEEHHFEKFRF